MAADKRTIAIDIDDVLAENNETMRRWTNDNAKTTFVPDDFRVKGDYWGYYERIWREHELHEVLSYEVFEEELIQEQVQMPLLPGASFAIKQLQQDFEVILITSRSTLLEPMTRRWLTAHFGSHVPEVYFAANSKDTARKSKGELCRELGAFLLIDDNLGHCESALEYNVEAILFGEYGWQHSIPDHIVRCKDWPTVLEYVNGRAE